MKVWNELASFLCWASKHLYNQNVGNLPLSRSWRGCFVVFDDELLLPGKMKQVLRWWLVRRTRKMRTLIKVRPGEMNATWKGNMLIWGMTELLWRKRKVRPCKVSCVSIERLTQITVAFSFGVCDDAPHCSSSHLFAMNGLSTLDCWHWFCGEGGWVMGGQEGILIKNPT